MQTLAQHLYWALVTNYCFVLIIDSHILINTLIHIVSPVYSTVCICPCPHLNCTFFSLLFPRCSTDAPLMLHCRCCLLQLAEERKAEVLAVGDLRRQLAETAKKVDVALELLGERNERVEQLEGRRSREGRVKLEIINYIRGAGLVV